MGKGKRKINFFLLIY